MRRGELFRVAKPGRGDPKLYRMFVIVARETVIQSKFSTIMCAPVYSRYDGLSTQVEVGIEEGLKHASAIHCDALMSLPKQALTHYVGTLSEEKMQELDRALAIALALE